MERLTLGGVEVRLDLKGRMRLGVRRQLQDHDLSEAPPAAPTEHLVAF